MTLWRNGNAPDCYRKLIIIIIMNTNQVGTITELEVLLYMTKLGYTVSIPYGDKERYDQIWDINGKLIRVQIKTANSIDELESAILVYCYSTSNGKRHKYTKDEIDYFATYWKNKVYLIPVEQCSTQKILRFSAPNTITNLKVVNWAKDYEVEEVLKQL